MVFEDECGTYAFNEEKGYYWKIAECMNISCPECGADLSEVFPEGCCNYCGAQNEQTTTE
jgi:hypothetical protein